MEREGSGIKKMKDSYLDALNFMKGKETEFYSDRSHFVVTFPNMNYGVIEEKTFYREQDTGHDEFLRIGNVSLNDFLAFCKQPKR